MVSFLKYLMLIYLLELLPKTNCWQLLDMARWFFFRLLWQVTQYINIIVFLNSFYICLRQPPVTRHTDKFWPFGSKFIKLFNEINITFTDVQLELTDWNSNSTATFNLFLFVFFDWALLVICWSFASYQRYWNFLIKKILILHSMNWFSIWTCVELTNKLYMYIATFSQFGNFIHVEHQFAVDIPRKSLLCESNK